MAENRRPVSVSPIRADKPTDNLPQSVDELVQISNTNFDNDGRLGMEVNYAPQVDEVIPKADKLAKTNLAEALELLAGLEKQSRLGSDMRSNSRLLRHMVKLAFEAKSWDVLNETILTMSKKRALIKFAIKNMVQDCCEMIDKIPSEEKRNKTVDTLRTVTAGKIYVEVERARLTKRVVEKLEKEGKIDEAWKELLELQVETFGSMEIKEKVQFLLDQMRLSIQRSDFVRGSIISNKISTKFFDDKSSEIQQLKIRYYTFKIAIGLHEKNYLDVCRHYRSILDTPEVQADEARVKETLKNVVAFVLLAPHGNEQWDQVYRINAIRQIELVPEYKSLLGLFINEEIINWDAKIVHGYEELLRRGTTTSAILPVVFATTEDGEKRWKTFKERVVEHNIRMVSKYYTQISFERLSELLELSVDEMEQFLCNLIVTGVIPGAKINRISRIINLCARKSNVETLDTWGSNVRKLTEILNKVTHLIQKERMVHQHVLDTAATRD